jgi:hypothetical protein
MRRLFEFFKTAGYLGGGSVLTSLALYLIAVYEHVNGRNVTSLLLITAGMIFFCFGAYLAWKKERVRVEALVRLSDEDPHIIAEFSKEKLPFGARMKTVGERPIYLRNLGKKHAYKVQIADVDLKHGIVSFPRVEILEDTPVPICSQITYPDDKPVQGASEFEVLLQLLWECEGYGKSRCTTVPMSISCEDHIGNKFSTKMLVSYGLDGTRAHDFAYAKESIIALD